MGVAGTVCGTMRSVCGAEAGCLAMNYQSLCAGEGGGAVPSNWSAGKVGFQGGLVFKAHRLVHHSTLGLRVIEKRGGAFEVVGGEGGVDI